MESIDIVPIGKYKGKPVTEALQDENYRKWFIGQPWAKEKYSVIYNIFVNSNLNTLGSPSPEHNKLQNLFLENDYVINFLRKFYDKETYKINFSKVTFEAEFNWDVRISGVTVTRENDVTVSVCRDKPHFIEIKTSLGEDYPNVLRKMKSQINQMRNKYREENKVWVNYSTTCNNKGRWEYNDGCRIYGAFILLIDNFTCDVTSKKELINIFSKDDIQVVFMDEKDTILTKEEKLEKENTALKQRIKILEEKLSLNNISIN
jgi:hypothetical protein